MVKAEQRPASLAERLSGVYTPRPPQGLRARGYFEREMRRIRESCGNSTAVPKPKTLAANTKT